MPTQTPVPPPTSLVGALDAATEVINADQSMIFDILGGRLPIGALNVFEAGSYLKYNGENVATPGDIDDPAYVGVSGEPNLWLPDYSLSSASTLDFEGQPYPYGVVHAVGCLQVGWNFVYSSEEEQPPSEVGESFPYEMIVQYQPSERIWLIVDDIYLGDPEGLAFIDHPVEVPSCSPSN